MTKLSAPRPNHFTVVILVLATALFTATCSDTGIEDDGYAPASESVASLPTMEVGSLDDGGLGPEKVPAEALDRVVDEAAGDNDRIDGAQPLGSIAVGGVITVRGTIDSERDEADHYALVVAEASDLSILLTFDVRPDLDLDLYGYMEGEEVLPAEGPDSLEEITIQLEEGEELVVKVAAHSGSGTYELVLVSWGREETSQSEQEIGSDSPR